MVDIHDYDIRCIEQEILWKYEDIRFDYSDYDCLLSLRKDMINKRVLEHQEEILPDIINFNEAMTEALRDMYDRAHRIWDSIKDNENFGEEPEVTAKCFLSYDYPKLHPIQEVWNTYHTLAQLIVPRLQAFKALDKHGYCPAFKDMREWNNAIQKMIDAFELMKYDFSFSDKEWKTITEKGWIYSVSIIEICGIN